jgi:DNA-binding transcriptional LysR family regulator
VPHRPRLRTDEMMSLRQAALDSVGIVQLPDYIVGGGHRFREVGGVAPRLAVAAGHHPCGLSISPRPGAGRSPFHRLSCGRDERGLMRYFPVRRRNDMARVGATSFRVAKRRPVFVQSHG